MPIAFWAATAERLCWLEKVLEDINEFGPSTSQGTLPRYVGFGKILRKMLITLGGRPLVRISSSVRQYIVALRERSPRDIVYTGNDPEEGS
jgi:hypothetical protein